MSNDLKQRALDFHEFPRPGKIGVAITKPTETQEALSLAYTPGVAEPVRAIAEDPTSAYRYTNKGNLVAVISDGSAVLGLGNVGALASKPVMEGKAVLFKAFADIDVFDIEVNAESPAAFIQTVMNIAPTFGGINLEDIKAPECFEILNALRERLDIPVFHDDQDGTAVIVAAALLNALELQDKKLDDVKIVCLGAGAAGVACMRMLTRLGAHKSNIYMLDRSGIIHTDRSELPPHKFMFARGTEKRTLAEAMDGADVFVGVSGANLLSAEELKLMAPKPIVFALSNPDPEIHPEVARAARDDIIMATGRSDFPNQVNNVLGFPYIFRGALDVQAKSINDDMLVAAVRAIQALAHEEIPKEVLAAYPNRQHMSYGPEYILPTPFDPRLAECVSKAVAEAAVKSEVALKPKELA